jgi:hypothetical protein
VYRNERGDVLWQEGKLPATATGDRHNALVDCHMHQDSSTSITHGGAVTSQHSNKAASRGGYVV